MGKTVEDSRKLLLSEYERLFRLEEINIINYEKATRLYLSVISIYVGIILFYFENGEKLNIPPTVIFYTGILLLTLGEITFLKMMGMDMGRLELGYALQKIRDYFIKIDGNLESSFVNRVHSHSSMFRKWSSFRGIIKRSLTLAQEKTFVVIINSLVFVSLVNFIFDNKIEMRFLLLLILFAIIVLFHMVYATWRYKITKKNIINEEFYWV